VWEIDDPAALAGLLRPRVGGSAEVDGVFAVTGSAARCAMAPGRRPCCLALPAGATSSTPLKLRGVHPAPDPPAPTPREPGWPRSGWRSHRSTVPGYLTPAACQPGRVQTGPRTLGGPGGTEGDAQGTRPSGALDGAGPDQRCSKSKLSTVLGAAPQPQIPVRLTNGRRRSPYCSQTVGVFFWFSC